MPVTNSQVLLRVTRAQIPTHTWSHFCDFTEDSRDASVQSIYTFSLMLSKVAIMSGSNARYILFVSTLLGEIVPSRFDYPAVMYYDQSFFRPQLCGPAFLRFSFDCCMTLDRGEASTYVLIFLLFIEKTAIHEMVQRRCDTIGRVFRVGGRYKVKQRGHDTDMAFFLGHNTVSDLRQEFQVNIYHDKDNYGLNDDLSDRGSKG